MNEIGGKLEGSRANSCHGQDSLGCRIFECAAMGSGGKRRALVLIAGYHTSETQGTAISIHNAGLSVGLIAGSSLSEFLSDHFGWRIGFYVLGGADLLLALAAQLFLLDHPEALPRVPPARSPLWTGVLDLVRIHSFLVIYGARSRRAIPFCSHSDWLERANSAGRIFQTMELPYPRPESTAPNISLLMMASPLASFSPTIYGSLADHFGFRASFTFALAAALAGDSHTGAAGRMKKRAAGFEGGVRRRLTKDGAAPTLKVP